MFNVVCYTHSEYSDVLDLYLKTIDQKFLGQAKIIFLSDIQIKNYETFIYDTRLSYSERWLQFLNWENCPTMFIYMHEDFIMYGVPDIGRLFMHGSILYDAYSRQSDIGAIRLINCGNVILQPTFINGLYEINEASKDIFAVQSTYWRKDTLKIFFEKCGPRTIWKLEEECQNFVDFKMLMEYNTEHRRGITHYDSKVFPYMATAVFKGKWNSEYKEELIKLFPDFDFNKRGWY